MKNITNEPENKPLKSGSFKLYTGGEFVDYILENVERMDRVVLVYHLSSEGDPIIGVMHTPELNRIKENASLDDPQLIGYMNPKEAKAFSKHITKAAKQNACVGKISEDGEDLIIRYSLYSEECYLPDAIRLNVIAK